MFDTMTFESDDEVKSTPIPDGTTAPVRLRRDRETGEWAIKSDKFKSEKMAGKSWMKLGLEVAEGEHKGRWADIMLTVDSKDFGFRNTVKVVTGLDLGQPGQQLHYDAFLESLTAGVFLAKLGPEKRRKKEGDEQYNQNAAGVPNGELYETGYSKCFKLLERVGERVEDDAPADDDEPAMIGMPGSQVTGGTSTEEDDDIPF